MDRSAANDDRQIEAELDREGVDLAYTSVIREYAEDASDSWRQCCGSSCDPCILRLGIVVDRIRRMRAEPPA